MITYSRIAANVLSDTCRLADSVAQVVAVDAGGGRGFGVGAGATVVHEAVLELVFLGVKQVGAFAAEAEGDLFGLFCGCCAEVAGGRGAGRHVEGGCLSEDVACYMASEGMR